MLWMLGLAAVVVDIIMRFTGSGTTTTTIDSNTTKPTTTTTHIPLRKIPVSPSDVTYIVINEKNNVVEDLALDDTDDKVKVLNTNQIDVNTEPDLSASFPASPVDDGTSDIEKRQDNKIEPSDVKVINDSPPHPTVSPATITKEVPVEPSEESPPLPSLDPVVAVKQPQPKKSGRTIQHKRGTGSGES